MSVKFHVAYSRRGSIPTRDPAAGYRAILLRELLEVVLQYVGAELWRPRTGDAPWRWSSALADPDNVEAIRADHTAYENATMRRAATAK